MKLSEIVDQGGFYLLFIMAAVGGNLAGFPMGVWLVSGGDINVLTFSLYGVGLIGLSIIGLFGKFRLTNFLERKSK